MTGLNEQQHDELQNMLQKLTLPNDLIDYWEYVLKLYGWGKKGKDPGTRRPISTVCQVRNNILKVSDISSLYW